MELKAQIEEDETCEDKDYDTNVRRESANISSQSFSDEKQSVRQRGEESKELSCGGELVEWNKNPTYEHKGIRTKFMGIIMFPTDSVGTDANMIPIAEKVKQERRMPRVKASASTI